jgi:hypothetical protein
MYARWWFAVSGISVLSKVAPPSFERKSVEAEPWAGPKRAETYTRDASYRDGTTSDTTPPRGKPVRFFAMSIHVLPPSRVMCSEPSSEPA